MNRRIEAIKIELFRRNIEGMIISNPKNVSYIIGMDIEGTILICKESNFLIVSDKYIEDVKNKITIDDEITILEDSTISESDYLDFFSDVTKVGFEEYYITYADYTKMLRTYRIKDPVETEKLIEKLREKRKDLE